MPEYLSPGVFIEEIPGRLKALEGVGTSTAAFVGPALRGTVPGFPLPFTPSGGFVLNPDPAPVFVTSFAEFTRQFGFALPLPSDVAADPDYGYLAYAARAFFSNGGRRCYIARVVDQTVARRGTHRVARGAVYRLQRTVRASETSVPLVSLRGLDQGSTLEFRRRSDGTNALAIPATASTLAIGNDATVALPGAFTLTVTAGGTAVPLALGGQPVRATATGPFAVPINTQLRIRLGPGAIVQTATFTAAASDAAGVVNVLSRDLTGVRVYVDAGNVVMDTDRRGTDARLEIVSDPTSLFGPPAFASGTNNVRDVDNLSADDIDALIPLPRAFRVTGTPGNLLITSTATGAVALSAAATPAPAAPRFGLPGVFTSGAAGSAPTFTVASYDTRAGTVTLSPALATATTASLDAGDVYAVSSSPPGAGGPKFWARTPGSWSSSISVAIAPADRPPVPIIAAVTAGAAATTTAITVQNPSSFYVGAVIEIDHDGDHHSYHEVTKVEGKMVTLGTAVATAIAAASFARVLEIDVVVSDETGAAPVEIYRGLSWSQGASADLRRHYANVINARSRLVYAQPPATEGADLASQPATANGFAERFPEPFATPTADEQPGADGLPARNGAGDAAYIGEDNGPGLRSGIESLKDLTDVRIIAAPGRTSQPVQLALISQCEILRYRFAILDAPQDAAVVSAILSHRSLYDTSFAAYYAPWLGVTVDGQLRFLPPSGYIAGVYARVDNSRGVWKAPANEPVFNIIDLKTNFTTGEQDILNPRGVNLIRRFEEGGIRVWGARTVSGDPELKYINVRRTLIFLEATIERGTQWVVFEPNTPNTWSRVTATIKGFLETQWRAGALFGRSADQAFFVRCDETTMSEDDVQNGRLICHIGVAIVRPAEFVIFRIEQITGFAKQ